MSGPGSSVGIVIGYGQVGPGIETWPPQRHRAVLRIMAQMVWYHGTMKNLTLTVPWGQYDPNVKKPIYKHNLLQC